MAVTTSNVDRTSGLPNPDRIDPADLIVRYDRTSDTLLILFGDRGRYGVVDYADHPDYLGVLRAVESDETVGVQIEDFLARAVVDDPTRLDLLEVADLRGISMDEVAALRAGVDVADRKRSTVAALLRAYPVGDRDPLSRGG